MVLATRCRRHGSKLRKCREHRDVAQPYHQKAIYKTGRATVVEALGEENERTLPGDETSATESQYCHETKVALETCLATVRNVRSQVACWGCIG